MKTKFLEPAMRGGVGFLPSRKWLAEMKGHAPAPWKENDKKPQAMAVLAVAGHLEFAQGLQHC